METRNITYSGKEYKVTKDNLSDDYIDIYVKDCMTGLCLSEYTDEELIDICNIILVCFSGGTAVGAVSPVSFDAYLTRLQRYYLQQYPTNNLT